MAINSVILVGRFTKDPELAQTQTGKSYCRFCVAVDKPAKSGEHPEANFIDCVAWGKTAEFICKYFSKGNRIGIQGSINTGSYEKDGKKIKTVDVWVDKADFVESKNNSATNATPAVNQQTPPVEETVEDIPF